MKKWLIISISFFCLSLYLHAQELVNETEFFLRGFGKEVSGENFSHYSHLEYAKDALIVYSKDKEGTITWLTDTVPTDTSEEFIHIVCIAGISGTCCGKNESRFFIEINGKKYFDFKGSSGETGFTVKNSDGSSLTFEEKLKDGSDDRFGLLSLRILSRQLKPGEPVRISVKSVPGGNGSWFMVFKTNLKEKELTASAPPIMLKGMTGKRIVNIDFTHYASPEIATVYFNDIQIKKEQTVFGDNRISFFIDEVSQSENIKVEVKTRHKNHVTSLDLHPLRKFEVAFIQHTHTDIGYTRPQTEILPEHIRFIDYALDYCDMTDDYPDEAKFRWTCETAWAVDEFIKTRPQKQIDRLVQRIKEGRIELTAMFFNFDELPDETTLAASLYPNKNFKKLDIDNIEVAMQNDVNGFGWCFTEYFEDMGIKYITMGENAHRALIPFDKPTYFWWESPSKKRVMAYVGDHYMSGNSIIGDFETFEKRLLAIITQRANDNFEYDIFPLQFMGNSGDNSPPSIKACENILKWNEKYTYPKIRLSLYKDFLSQIEREYGDNLQTIRGAWPDWWTDGFASGAREAAAFRQAQVNNISNQAGLGFAKLMGFDIPENTFQRIHELEQALLFYGEHTFGADRSVREPFHEETMLQRELKQSYVWEAYRRSTVMNESVVGNLQEKAMKVNVPSILVFNPLNWEYSGLVKIYADHVVLPHNGAFAITDGEGNIIPAQLFKNRGDGAFWLLEVKKLPALGYKQFFIDLTANDQLSVTSKKRKANGIYENNWYKITIDKMNGVITGLFDKDLQEELLDTDSEWPLGTLIYEELEDRRSHELYDRGNVIRSIPDKMEMETFQEGIIWDTYLFRGDSKAGQGDKNLSLEIKIYHNQKQIDLCYSLRKKLNTNAEAVYVSFPFQLEGGKIYFEVPGGTIEAGVEQVIGTSNDWNTVQNFATIRNSNSQIICVSHEVPLMQFGNINTGRYNKDSTPESEKIFSYVMNNYWTTNFNADQHGGFSWTYNLTSKTNNNIQTASEFGAGSRTPFLYRVIPAVKEGNIIKKSEGQILHIDVPNIFLVNMKPVENRNEVILHLREVKGEDAPVTIRCSFQKNMKVTACNVLGEDLPEQPAKITLKPWETRFVKLSW